MKMLDKWLEREGDLKCKINTLKDQLGQKSKEIDELRLSHQGKYWKWKLFSKKRDRKSVV